ncbi:hypothetical protein [Paenibacillus sonchi]|uniref:hypothetical protein n=1 Tax=Paenibacillus sonchi TaxID=373687 RepID=UPI001E32E488|nr:hypothetical protein [Paenibacillus sonchi]MCE3199963.1 hypothetical protein [Paenibacillus sonchi]
MIKGIFETHINVSDYAKSAQFYEKLPGVLPLYEDTARKSKFYGWTSPVNPCWVSGRIIQPHSCIGSIMRLE